MKWLNKVFKKPTNKTAADDRWRYGYEAFISGKECYKKRNFKDALNFFDEAIDNGYNDANVFYYRAGCLDDLEYYPEAIGDYDKAISIDSHKANVYYARYLAKFAIGDWAGGINDLKDAISISKQINGNSKFWNEYAESTGYESATARYELDLTTAEQAREHYQNLESGMYGISQNEQERRLKIQILKNKRRK